jgi:uncharacterized membrane protein SpoIIM required for sporulation
VDVESYIARHRPEWEQLEQRSRGGGGALARSSGPQLSEVIRLYLRASAQLAEVQTTYPGSELESYLNGLVARAHGAIYSASPRSFAAALRFFAVRYRQAVRRTVPYILAAAAVLAGVALATQLWVALSPEAQAGVVPPFAREAADRAGTGGRVGIPPPELSTLILVNNVGVAFASFAFGIGLGIGTIYVLVKNALLLGMLAGAFQAAGHAGAFWALILPHGLLELTAICIAAGSGLRMGWSLIDPGDRPRGRALAEESRDAVLVVVGVIPAFVIAALIEGFLTRSPLPDGIEIAAGAAVALAYVLFLVGRPRRSGSEPPVGLDAQVLVGQPAREPAGR